MTDFVEECKLMSQLRHPHIVQFLGVAYLPGSPIPVLLMEKLQTSLDNLLETSPNITQKLFRDKFMHVLYPWSDRVKCASVLPSLLPLILEWSLATRLICRLGDMQLASSSFT